MLPTGLDEVRVPPDEFEPTTGMTALAAPEIGQRREFDRGGDHGPVQIPVSTLTGRLRAKQTRMTGGPARLP